MIIYFLGRLFGVVYLIEGAGGGAQEVPFFMAFIFTVVLGVIAVGVYWLLARFTSAPSTIFWWVALVIGIISFIPDYAATLNDGTFVLLGVMHVVAAGFLVYYLTVIDQKEIV